ncbi:SDR family NAD(P)-dependent oxidoreductase [Sphaerisporangium sp. TRM90804]|uniref:SDR family oxidoreductase n=1 Tax=Sphaerisporangium sp. TRM90804 TaxID=3031113 RepID=UPI00244B4C42|nr:SDR family NAD(P)-dependent oxidoreductase [Sphaerisporangium sp. TRM90804]MDH2427293.1 SDR family NAD(P)-dependent oxidoreductase [Sphaerisporangium sp. TRM90804]
MELEGKHVVVTGGGGGIGRALAVRFARQAASVVVVDRDGEAAREAAAEAGGLAITADVGREGEILRVIAEAEEAYGPIDLFCSNAGSAQPTGGVAVPDEAWQRLWNVHVMAHIWAARALVPAMVERGDGYLLNTASAAALLMTPGAVPYTVTKHAALALAESLAVLYRGTGVRFSCLCPGLVDTPLLDRVEDPAVDRAVRMASVPVAPADVAEIVVRGLREERFLILTHPETTDAALARARDPESYLGFMADLWTAAGGRAAPGR